MRAQRIAVRRATRPVATGPRWRRLDPRMLLVHPVNEVVRFLPALIGVFLIGRSLDEGGWWHVAAVAVPVALGLLRYATTTFRIGDGVIELRRGLLNRATVTARLDRVRTVDLTSSLIHRLLGLAKVEIGTGSAGDGASDRLRLDALALPQARALRASLLHPAPSGAAGADSAAGGPREPVAAVGTLVTGDTGETGDKTGDGTRDETRCPVSPRGHAETVGVPEPPADAVLLRLRPGWVRYAPLTTAGLVVAAAVAGAVSQFVGPVLDRWHALRGVGSLVGAVPLWLLVVVGAVAAIAAISVLAIVGYLLSYWGFTLSKDPAGRSIHVARGMLTTREVSVEAARVRGLEWHEPLGLRLAHAARLGVIVTGLSRREAGAATVTPPAPRGVAERVAAALFDGAGVLSVPVTGHGPRATARRYTRALGVAAVAAAGWAVLVLAQGWPVALVAAGALPITLALALAADRARRLGHALTPGYLVVRAHSLRGRRDALAREGIIGWNVRQSFFQRRAGLVTLTATTAAGKQGYRVDDIPEPAAVALADAATPGMLTPFLVRAPVTTDCSATGDCATTGN